MYFNRDTNFPQYEKVHDETGGVIGFVDPSTGEFTEAVTAIVPSGTKHLTPKDQEAYQNRKNAQEEIAQKKYYRSNKPRFYFAKSEDRNGSIAPQNLARLFFLATYLDYNDSILYRSKGIPLKKAELPKLMKLSKQAFLNFWNAVDCKYITENEDGTISLCKDFYRGELSQAKSDMFDKYQQVFIDTMRQLYLQCPASKHVHLGYLFALIPYINYQWNILCWNPEETDRDKIQYMSIEEFCGLIGYSANQKSRLLKVYTSMLYYEQDGREKLLCSYLTDAHRREYFIINPRVLYRGSDPSKVEALTLFFRN